MALFNFGFWILDFGLLADELIDEKFRLPSRDPNLKSKI